jgi:hypothetical protein
MGLLFKIKKLPKVINSHLVENSPNLVTLCEYLIRVARWFVFIPKIQIWVNFGGSCTGRCWYILWTLGPFYILLLYFMEIWYSSS